MHVCSYESMKVFKHTIIHACKYAYMQLFNFTNVYTFKHTIKSESHADICSEAVIS